jgi:hypothetical protein
LTEGNKSKQMHQYATSSPTTVFWFVLTQKSASQRSLGINCDISFCTVGVFSRVGVVVDQQGISPSLALELSCSLSLFSACREFLAVT